MEIDTAAAFPSFDISAQIRTPHNARLYTENQRLSSLISSLIEYQLANPSIPNPTSRGDVDHAKEVDQEIELKKRRIRAQLAVIKTLYRQSVLKVREEKSMTSEGRAVNDALILQLHNLKYEEQSLEREIGAAEGYDHKYTKLPLISEEEFLEEFPEHRDATPHEIMIARIEHEYRVRVKKEEQRQEKLKQKQMLIAEVKKRKDDLTKLDGMLEKFIDAADPIQKALATERIGKLLLELQKTASGFDMQRSSTPTAGVLVDNPERNLKSISPSGPVRQLTLREKLRIELEAVESEIARLRKRTDSRDRS